MVEGEGVNQTKGNKQNNMKNEQSKAERTVDCREEQRRAEK
jgi:hypothetical protein